MIFGPAGGEKLAVKNPDLDGRGGRPSRSLGFPSGPGKSRSNAVPEDPSSLPMYSILFACRVRRADIGWRFGGWLAAPSPTLDLPHSSKVCANSVRALGKRHKTPSSLQITARYAGQEAIRRRTRLQGRLTELPIGRALSDCFLCRTSVMGSGCGSPNVLQAGAAGSMGSACNAQPNRSFQLSPAKLPSLADIRSVTARKAVSMQAFGMAKRRRGGEIGWEPNHVGT